MTTQTLPALEAFEQLISMYKMGSKADAQINTIRNALQSQADPYPVGVDGHYERVAWEECMGNGQIYPHLETIRTALQRDVTAQLEVAEKMREALERLLEQFAVDGSEYQQINPSQNKVLFKRAEQALAAYDNARGK